MGRLRRFQIGLTGLGSNKQYSSGSTACKLAASDRIFFWLLHMHDRIFAVAEGPRAPLWTGTEAYFRDVVELSSRPRLTTHACGENVEVTMLARQPRPSVILHPGEEGHLEAHERARSRLKHLGLYIT